MFIDVSHTIDKALSCVSENISERPKLESDFDSKAVVRGGVNAIPGIGGARGLVSMLSAAPFLSIKG
jgi:hypothetical protein